MGHNAEETLNEWHMLLFDWEKEYDDIDDACKAEEVLMGWIIEEWNPQELDALAQAAQKRIAGREPIDPEDESQDRELRFYSFIAQGRAQDVDLL